MACPDRIDNGRRGPGTSPAAASLYRVSRPPRRETEPLEIEERLPIGIGIVCFAIALVVLLVLRHSIAEVNQWWIWMCVAGIGGGLFGFFYTPYIKRKRGIR